MNSLTNVPSIETLVLEGFQKTKDGTFETVKMKIISFELGKFSKKLMRVIIRNLQIESLWKSFTAFEIKFQRDLNEKRKIFDIILGIAPKSLSVKNSNLSRISLIFEQNEMLPVTKLVCFPFMLNTEISLPSRRNLFLIWTQQRFVNDSNQNLDHINKIR